jgi:hypothetical protein
MPSNAVKKPKMKEINPGYGKARKGVKVKMKGNPLGVKVVPTNPTKKGGIFRATKGKAKK